MLENIPDAFAYHQIIADETGNPLDYLFLEINDAFEKMTGLKRSEVIGRKVTEVLPGIEDTSVDWISIYGKVALSGKPVRFENYSEPLDRWYDVSAYSDEPGYFMTLFHDISKRKEIEKELSESMETFATTFHSIGDGVIATDEYGKIINMNPAAEKICEWSSADAKGVPFAEVFNIVNAKTRKAADDPIRQVFESGEVVGLANHTMLISKTGTEYHIADSAAPIKNRKGEITGVVVVFNDVTEKYLITEKLRVSEERLNLAMAVKNEGLWDWNLVTDETFFDNRYYTMAGYQPEEFPQTFAAWAEHVHPEDLPEAQRAINDYLDGESSLFDTEFRFKKKDGAWMWIRGKGKIFERDKSGSPLRMIGTHTDITEHKKAVEQLRRIEWMLNPERIVTYEGRKKAPEPPYGSLTDLNRERLIMESVDSEVLLDIANDYLHLLETSTAIYEKNGDYALGIFSSGWCRTLDSAARKLCNTENNQAALESGKWLCHESCWTNASKIAIESGEPCDIDCHGGLKIYAVPIWADNRVIGAINFGYGNPPENDQAIEEIAAKYQIDAALLIKEARAYEARPPFIIDVAKNRLQGSAKLIGVLVERNKKETEIQLLNEELEQRVKDRTAQLEAANKELEAFAYSVSHDLRAPLRALGGFSEALLSSHAANLDEEGEHYLNRIQVASVRMGDLIDDLLKLSRVTRTEFNYQTINISQLVREIVAVIEADQTDRQVKWIVREDLVTRADARLLQIVLENLLDNAWKYTEPKHNAIIEIGMSEQDGENVYFVRDNGVGFDMTYANKLFLPFQRLHIANQFSGTGIGLATVKRIITRHGGRVWAEAIINQGATFYFTLEEAEK